MYKGKPILKHIENIYLALLSETTPLRISFFLLIKLCQWFQMMSITSAFKTLLDESEA